ncbi:hypothetical protein [Salinirubrum litoreum]|uniref:Protein CcmA, bactofilin family n=1 Tax=Salinirubrum litoreum TaxID=1126234 RepID=A0ABD5RA91_9EURY|nr:hypothetical protein [Salinirubrum litoreum]
MVRPRRLRPSFALVVLVLVVPALLVTPGAVAGFGGGDAAPSGVDEVAGAAPDDTTALGTTVVVPAGETTSGSITASGSRVVVAGRHEGDLKLYGGTVLVAGNVTGDVQAFGATVRVTGTVGGSLVAYGGSVELADSGRVEALFNTGGSRVLLDGTVNSSVQATGGRVILGESASVARAMTYDARLVDRGGSVAGGISQTNRFLGPLGTLLRGLRFLPVLAPLLGLVAGLAGRRWLPATTTDLSDRLAEHPRRSLLSGLGGLLGAGVLAGLLVVSVVGLPLVVVFVCLAGLGGLLGLAVTQSAVGRVVVRQVGIDRVAGVGVDSLGLLVGAGVGLLVGVAVVVGGGLLSVGGLGLLTVASVGGIGTVVARVRETDDYPTLTSRFG